MKRREYNLGDELNVYFRYVEYRLYTSVTQIILNF